MTLSEQHVFDALMRQKLSYFTRKVFHTVSPADEYLHNWHIDLIAEHLEACHRREIKRLIINIPPRYMKSICVTTAFPAWLLGHNPSERIVAASYAAKLAIKHSLDCRLVMQSPWYQRVFPHTMLAPDQNEKQAFMTTERGHRIATSVGASVIGEGGNYLIVDDPHSASEALSAIQRQAALTWFDQSFTTRLNDKKNGVIIVVMQRLHEQDLTGHLLEKGGWHHLCVPAIQESRKTYSIGGLSITREAGSLLHEERESAEQMRAIQRELGSYAFAGQYQQQPSPSEGGLIKLDWFKRYAAMPFGGTIIHSWDTASKGAEYNDPSVCTVWHHENGQHKLLDVYRRRVEYPELKRAVQSMAMKWPPHVVLIEDKSSGQSLIQDLRTSSQLPIVAIEPHGDKITRVMRVSAVMESGACYLPEQAEWLVDFESELSAFPNSAHDDQCDSVSQYLNYMLERFHAAQPRIRRL